MRARAIADQLAHQGEIGNRASLAAALGERDEAMRLLREDFQEAWSRGNWMTGRHRAQALELLDRYPPYEVFMRPRG